VLVYQVLFSGLRFDPLVCSLGGVNIELLFSGKYSTICEAGNSVVSTKFFVARFDLFLLGNHNFYISKLLLLTANI
jgi:hypothetical protein